MLRQFEAEVVSKSSNKIHSGVSKLADLCTLWSICLRGEIFRKIIQVLPQPALEVHSVLVNRPQLGIEKFGSLSRSAN